MARCPEMEGFEMKNSLLRWRSALLALALALVPIQAQAVDDIWDYDAATPGNNTNIGGVNYGEGMLAGSVNNGVRELISQLKRGIANQGSDISSVGGAPAICGTGTSIYAKVTGTTTITSFGTAAAGCWRIVTFTGALTLTHNATSLILPSAANITTAAGDVIGAVSEGSGNWRVITYSRVAILASANTFTAAQTITTTGTGTLLTLTSTDAGAGSGPNVTLHRDSASPAASDVLARVSLDGEDSGGTQTQYAAFTALILDPTDGSEDGRLRFDTVQAGTFASRLNIEAGVYTTGATGTDKGVGTINATGLYVNGHGTVAQRVTDTEVAYTDLGVQLPFDDSIPQNTEGDEIMTVAITPTNASSTLFIDVTVHLGGASGETQVAALFVDTTANALAMGSTNMINATTMNTVTFRHSVTAGSTSARTYKVRAGSSTTTNGKLNGHNSSRIGGGITTSSITVTEVLPQ
jgi:hypothetical protein